MAYKPLDLSFMSARSSPEGESIRNTAAMIMANAGWSKPSQRTLAEIAAANKKAKEEYNSAHKQSFLSGVFDLLQTPLYGIANALDESMAGHQESSDDNFVEDIGKSIGGLATGAVRGVGAGLRGASGILDAIPGVDISDEWQSDPTDKTHLSDVMLRKTVGMSTADALKPENLEKVKAALKESQDKPFWDKSPGQIALEPLIPDLDDPELQEKYVKRNTLASIPLDIAIDPLNAVALPSKAGTVSKGLTEGLEEARKAEPGVSSILSGLKNRSFREFTPKASLDAKAPIGAIPESVPAGTSIDLPGISPTLPKGNFKTLENLGRREGPEKAAKVIGGGDQAKIVKQIMGLAMSGDKSWAYKAADILAKHPNVTWSETEKLLEKANSVIKSIGQRGVKGLAPALREQIATDVANVRAASTVERRIANTADVDDIAIARSGPRLKASEAKLANQVVRKFEREILHTGRAPGTYEGLARAMASGRNVRYSGPQQVRMWNDITTNLKYSNPSKFDKAVRILRSVEDYFKSKGAVPHSWANVDESTPLRLSRVIEVLGPQEIAKNHAYLTGILRGDPKALAHLSPDKIWDLRQVRADEAIDTAPAVQRGLQAGREIADVISKIPASVGRKKDVINTAIRDVKTFTATSGGGDVGAHIAGENLKNLLGRSDPINAALSANRIKTEAWLGKIGKSANGATNDPEFLRSVTNAISKASDLPSPASLSGVVGAKAKVVDWLGARFNAAYGVQDMRPIFLREQSSAMSTTARRARLINDLGRRFDPSDSDLWHEAFRAAQLNGVPDGAIAPLQSEISKVMENLFGGTGLRSGAIADSTIVGRNRLLMDELNKNLRRFGLSQYEFAAKKVKDAAGVEHDFSKGMDWMRSWEAWDVKKPYEFLHRVQNAIEFTVREKTMFDEIASRFGSSAKLGDVKYGVDHPRLRGYFFTREGAEQARVFTRMLEEVSTPNSKSLQYFDHVLSKLKASLTIYIPGHHWTNLIGDMYYNWIAGVNKPIRYEQAMKTMLAQKGRYGNFADFDKLTGPEALQKAIARSLVKPDAGLAIAPAGNKVIIKMSNGTKVTADMIYTAAFREGILPSAKVLEDVQSDVTSILDKIHLPGKAKGKAQQGVHKVSEIRDHIPRLAQFIDVLAKHRGSFQEAVNSGARSVRKWHPDGLDLTQFERGVLKRVFPFYSWTRKAIPLAIEASIFAAPKVMAYPRLMEAIALSNGIDPNQGMTDPFPSDQMFPDWLRDRGIGPVMGGAGAYKVINPSTPVLDTLTLLGHPGQSSVDMLNPMVKVPIEVGQGQTLGRNVPIGSSTGDWTDYAAKQIPIASQLGRASGQFGVSDSTKAEGFPNYTNILNLLTGAKMVDTGKYQKSAQFDLRDYLKQKAQQQGR